MADVRPNQIVAWDAVVGADSYDVVVSNLGGTILNAVSTTETQKLISELLAGQALGLNFTIKVRAVDAFGPGVFSAPLSLTLVGLPAPLNVRII